MVPRASLAVRELSESCRLFRPLEASQTFLFSTILANHHILIAVSNEKLMVKMVSRLAVDEITFPMPDNRSSFGIGRLYVEAGDIPCSQVEDNGGHVEQITAIPVGSDLPEQDIIERNVESGVGNGERICCGVGAAGKV